MTTETTTTKFIFAHETLTPIVGKPTHASIKLLTKEIYANAYQNKSQHIGGKHGYLGIVMPDSEFQKFQEGLREASVPFVQPGEPNPALPKEERDIINKTRHNYDAMDQSLQQLMIAAVERTWIHELEHELLGFAPVTSKQMLAYLTATYSKITHADLTKNREKLQDDWDVSEPIHTLWTRISEIQQYALDGKKPIDDDTIMHATLEVLHKTGVFGMNITLWQSKPTDTWTLPEFKKFFDEANTNREACTAKQAGYSGANNVKGVKKSTTEKSPPGANITATTISDADHANCMKFGKKTIYYCWSHGGTTSAEHTSQTCTRPYQGHVRTATWEDMQGGNGNHNWSKANKNFNLQKSKAKAEARATRTATAPATETSTAE
jgi:hypothetical protein